MRSLRIGVWVSVFVLGTLLLGCRSSSVDSGPRELASRQSLNADELDALTAAGEGGEVVGTHPAALEDGFQPIGSTLNDASGSLPSGQLQMPSRPSMTLPSVRQTNSIRQAR